MAKDPAFLFYPNDWIGGTMGMTFEEKGAYMELLMMQFNRGHMSEHMIKHMINDIWLVIKDKFIQDENGLWYNKRLEEEQNKRKCFTESRRNNKITSFKKLESDSNETDIYIIKDVDSGNIKIGASVNPENRLSTIKSRQNKNVVLIATLKNCTLKDEKDIHFFYKDFNITGDWFNLNENDVIKYINNHMKRHMIIHMENENVNENKDTVNTWRTDLKIYLSELKQVYYKLLSDQSYLAIQERLHPGVDIKLSIEKAVINFWGTEAGWKHKKKSKAKDIDWKSTLTNAIDLNKVYKQRNGALNFKEEKPINKLS